VNGGYIDLPTLFIAARYDIVCEAVDSRLADPMKAFCRNLTTDVVMSGHRMALEKPAETNSILARWLATNVPECWPTRR
jgi:soluble epoxide hydrolase/lipid-phosphate phosphatase